MKPVEYKGFSITHEPKPIPTKTMDYDWIHPDYDGADGGNGLCGNGQSVEDCKEQIDELLDEQ